MRKISRAWVALVVLFVAIPMLGATPQEFYLNLLRRGVADFNAGRFEAAEGELRIAAFGLVESIDSYQTAHVYLALTADRLGHTEEARRAVGRVQAAQRVQARYAQLSLPPEVRSAFDALVRRVAPSTAAVLGTAPGVAAAATPQTVATQPPPVRQTAAAQPPPVRQTTASQPPPVQQTTASQPPPVRQTATAETPTVIQREISVEEIPVDPPKVTTTTTTTKSTTVTPTTTTTVTPTPTPRPMTSTPAPRRDLASAERALDANDLPTARVIFREHLEASPNRATLLRIAEGLYRARDFAGALIGLRRLGELQLSERPYRYYIAVALYETGDYAGAKRELLAALPHIELTPDVERYRAKILGAIN
ncbi:MAG TPA: hypothetical protein VF111_05545 [Thermoanaerobaculia bacterium]